MRHPAWWEAVCRDVAAYQQANPENLPGAVFAAETREDGPLVASIGAWRTDAICEIGSMTKAFTATAVLTALEDRGLLDVETPVWTLPGMDAYAADDLRRQIRVRHLLQHTAGLPGVRPYDACPEAPCNAPGGGAPACPHPDLDLGPTAPWIGAPGITNECVCVDGRCIPARTATLDQVSRYLMETYGPAFPPGEQYAYSSYNYIVAARLVETLSGMAFNRFLKERLFEPLGMRDSFFTAQPTGDASVDRRQDDGTTDGQRARIPDVTILTPDGRLPPEVAPGPGGRLDRYRTGWRYVYPDGGMFSTAADLLAFLRLLRDGGLHEGRRLLSADVVRLLVQDQGFGHTMGFGFRSQTTPYGQGTGTLEHMGRYMTYFWYDPRPEAPLLGVFLSQRLTNVAVQTNMAEGMQVIFRVFVPGVKRGVYGAPVPSPA